LLFRNGIPVLSLSLASNSSVRRPAIRQCLAMAALYVRRFPLAGALVWPVTDAVAIMTDAPWNELQEEILR